MRLKTAQIQNYRSVLDTGEFEVDHDKTILVGINEAGKSAVLQTLQHINPPKDIAPLDPLRDYPRAHYNDISRGIVDPAKVPVATVTFELEDADRAALPEGLRDIEGLLVVRYLDNKRGVSLLGAPAKPSLKSLSKDLLRLSSYLDTQAADQETPPKATPSEQLKSVTDKWNETNSLSSEQRASLKKWLEGILPEIEEGSDHEKRYDTLIERLDDADDIETARTTLIARIPVFVLFSNYFRVRARLQLEALARKQAGKDEIDRTDYGNICLLNLLGFTAKELSDLGRVTDEERQTLTDSGAIAKRLDERGAKLNAAEAMLTREIRSIWNPDPDKDEAKTLRIFADGAYLKVTVEDSIGVNIDLDQRSEGFQWLVSFFVVFFSEAQGNHENAILLLDEPGVSLHALKQREFQKTISRLAETNQTIFSTHSPFLVGSGELDKVRVVEMTNREVGTKVHTTVKSSDPAALLPLQEALGYDMAHSLFAHERNLITEGLTDYFYVDAMTQLLRSGGVADLNPKIAIVPAGDAGKVVYFATILHAHNLKVAALLDSDPAGENAARQDTLVHTLKQRAIVRTRDFLKNEVKGAEIEDLLRETLIGVANTEFGTNAKAIADAQPKRPIVDILAKEVPDFSKYKLAKAFARWSREHAASDLTDDEREQWKALVDHLNKALK